ncbi:COMM domain-containing protein 6 isoform X2 [Narcine bancroftii]|uniref:COMM domain-containing protein 6 isoform X2 n=1 Tax=Narcine bancroftii TaxID=1343680 RepID=UPI0038316521
MLRMVGAVIGQGRRPITGSCLPGIPGARRATSSTGRLHVGFGTWRQSEGGVAEVAAFDDGRSRVAVGCGMVCVACQWFKTVKKEVEVITRVPISSFENSIESISKLPQDLFAEVCQQIMFHLQCKTPGVNILEVAERLQKAGVELDVEATKQIVHVISLIFSKAAAQSGISAEELVIKLANSSSKWSKQALQVIRHVWNEQGKLIGTTEDAKHMLTVGELVDLQWKLGMAVSSDSCRSLNYPYVTMVLKVADPSGEIIRRSFEMTVPQFQLFPPKVLWPKQIKMVITDILA